MSTKRYPEEFKIEALRMWQRHRRKLSSGRCPATRMPGEYE